MYHFYTSCSHCNRSFIPLIQYFKGIILSHFTSFIIYNFEILLFRSNSVAVRCVIHDFKPHFLCFNCLLFIGISHFITFYMYTFTLVSFALDIHTCESFIVSHKLLLKFFKHTLDVFRLTIVRHTRKMKGIQSLIKIIRTIIIIQHLKRHIATTFLNTISKRILYIFSIHTHTFSTFSISTS